MVSGDDAVRSREMVEFGEWDWWVLPEGRRLHAATVPYDPVYDVGGSGVTACGRRGLLFIPGLFSRMGAERCSHCCRAMGFPLGKGSPKNDKRCRPLVKRRLSRLALR